MRSQATNDVQSFLVAKTSLSEEDMLRAYQTHTSNPVFMNAGKNKLQ
jgi:hypothetical protein